MDVAGIDEAVEELKEVRDFRAYSKGYQKMGASKHPARRVFVGSPSGHGQDAACQGRGGGEAAPFFSISALTSWEMFAGASRAHLFWQAKAAAPCIIFIDGIDAVGRQRGSRPLAVATTSARAADPEPGRLLVEMDG